MEYIIAFYFAGVLLAMFKIWLPSYKLIKLVDPDNPLIASPVMSTLVVLLIFTLFFPFMILTLLFDNQAIKFIEHFTRGAIGDYDKKR